MRLRLGKAMANDVARVIKKVTDSKRLLWLFGVGITFFGSEIFVETFFQQFLEEHIFLKFLVRFVGGAAEISILSAFFGIFFDYKERRELIDEAAEKFGLLGRISQIGIQDFRDDSKRYDHKEDFENSEELEIFVFGSSDFFRTRFDIIKRRLVSGKVIKIVVHEDRHDGIKKLLEMLKIHEVYDECVVNLKVFCQPKAPRYNYIKTDSGIWVKSYFMNTKNLEYGAPAFFIEKDTQLYRRYMKDLSRIIETELAGENLENFVATVS